MNSYLEGAAAGIGIAFIASNTIGFLSDYHRTKKIIIKEQADYASRARAEGRIYIIGGLESKPLNPGHGGSLALRRFKQGRFDDEILAIADRTAGRK